MKGPKGKWSVGRLGRSILLLGVVGATAAALATGAATVARADTPPTNPGGLTFSPASGSADSGPGTITMSANACPAGFNGSAVIYLVNPDFSLFDGTLWGPTVFAAASPFTAPNQESINDMVIEYGSDSLIFAIACYTGTIGTGPYVLTDSDTITVDPNTNTYNTVQAPATATHVSLATVPAGQTSVDEGDNITFEATVSADDSTQPAGQVQFAVNGSTTGIAPVSVAAGSTTADYTTSFPSAGSEQVTASFTPTDTTDYNASPPSNTVTVTVEATGTITAANSPVTIDVTVLSEGTFAVTVEPPTTISLTRTAAYTYNGTLPNIQVDDNRNTFPGWSVSGLESPFQGSGTAAGHTISGSQLGWAPNAVTTPVPGVTVDDPTPPGAPGLGTTTELANASVDGGFGLGQLFNAALTLDVPTNAPAGDYEGQLTITAVPVAP